MRRGSKAKGKNRIALGVKETKGTDTCMEGTVVIAYVAYRVGRMRTERRWFVVIYSLWKTNFGWTKSTRAIPVSLCGQHILFALTEESKWLVSRNIWGKVKTKKASQADWWKLLHQDICNECLSAKGQHKPILVSSAKQNSKSAAFNFCF